MAPTTSAYPAPNAADPCKSRSMTLDGTNVNGALAEIRSDADNELFIAVAQVGQSYWVAARKDGAAWIWTSDSAAVDRTGWTEHNNHTNVFVALDVNKTQLSWSTDVPTSNRGIMCEFCAPSAAAPTATADELQRPVCVKKTFERIDTGIATNQAAAASLCASRTKNFDGRSGVITVVGSLPELRTSLERNALRDVAHVDKRYWLNAKKRRDADVWEWISDHSAFWNGESQNGATVNWAAAEPKNSDVHLSVQKISGGTLLWLGEAQSDTADTICEFCQLESTTTPATNNGDVLAETRGLKDLTIALLCLTIALLCSCCVAGLVFLLRWKDRKDAERNQPVSRPALVRDDHHGITISGTDTPPLPRILQSDYIAGNGAEVSPPCGRYRSQTSEPQMQLDPSPSLGAHMRMHGSRDESSTQSPYEVPPVPRCNDYLTGVSSRVTQLSPQGRNEAISSAAAVSAHNKRVNAAAHKPPAPAAASVGPPMFDPSPALTEPERLEIAH